MKRNLQQAAAIAVAAIAAFDRKQFRQRSRRVLSLKLRHKRQIAKASRRRNRRHSN